MWERRATRGVTPFVALGVLIGLAATFVFASPRTVDISPVPNAAGLSSLTPITIAFNQPMDTASVEARLRVAPETEGDYAVNADGKIVRFVPRVAWPEGATVVVSLAAGARSARGLPLLVGRTWQFSIGAARIAYLADSGGPANILTIPLAGGEAMQLTRASHGVLDFAASPDGTRLAYAAVRDDGGSDLRAVNANDGGDVELLACPGEGCRAAQWSPDARLIAFERRPLIRGAGGKTRVGEPRTWLLDLTAGEAWPVPPEGHVTAAPRWSAAGLLAYYDSSEQMLVVVDLVARQTTLIANDSGEMGAWSSDGLALIFADIVFTTDAPTTGSTTAATATAGSDPAAPAFYSHLVQVEVATRARQELSVGPLVEDAGAAPAPLGAWIAFGRKYLDAARWTPGRQLWLMRPDGSNAHALTDAGDYHHSAVVWSPDGRRVVFTRFNIASPGASPELWTVNVDGSDARLLVERGYLPTWLP